TGFFYHSARYYAPWLARWSSADPTGLRDGTNNYAYSRQNPICFQDPSGTDATPHPREEEAQASLPAMHGTVREEVEQRSIPEEHVPELIGPPAPPQAQRAVTQPRGPAPSA